MQARRDGTDGGSGGGGDGDDDNDNDNNESNAEFTMRVSMTARQVSALYEVDDISVGITMTMVRRRANQYYYFC